MFEVVADGNGDKLREPDSIGREGLGIGRQGESKIYVSRRHKSTLSPLPRLSKENW